MTPFLVSLNSLSLLLSPSLSLSLSLLLYFYQQQYIPAYVDEHNQHKRPRHSKWGGEDRKIPLQHKVRDRRVGQYIYLYMLMTCTIDGHKTGVAELNRIE